MKERWIILFVLRIDKNYNNYNHAQYRILCTCTGSQAITYLKYSLFRKQPALTHAKNTAFKTWFFRAIEAQARISSLNASEIKSEKLSSPLHNIFQAQHQRMNSEKVTACLRWTFLFPTHGGFSRRVLITTTHGSRDFNINFIKL